MIDRGNGESEKNKAFTMLVTFTTITYSAMKLLVVFKAAEEFYIAEDQATEQPEILVEELKELDQR